MCDDDDDATVILPDAANASASANDLNLLCFAPGKLFTWASQSALCDVRRRSKISSYHYLPRFINTSFTPDVHSVIYL